MAVSRHQCPKGTICFSWTMFAVLVILAVLLFAFFKPAMHLYNQASLLQSKSALHGAGMHGSGMHGSGMYGAGMHREPMHREPMHREPMHHEPAPRPIVIINRGGDDRYTRAPQPLRRPDFDLLPQIATRGDYGNYQQMGIIERNDGSLYPLFGRRTYRSDKFNYYTRTDTYNPVQLPIHFDKRDCTDDNGCNELSSGDTVRLNGSETGKIKLYNSSIMQP